ncbi:MAG: hypothetical protein V3S01_04395, partial [Dehalococcoidia bacterium]
PLPAMPRTKTRVSPLSMSVPSAAREMGIVFGAILGVVFLGEGYGVWRILGALLILGGVLTLGLAP